MSVSAVLSGAAISILAGSLLLIKGMTAYFRMDVDAFCAVGALGEIGAFLRWVRIRATLFLRAVGPVLAPHFL